MKQRRILKTKLSKLWKASSTTLTRCIPVLAPKSHLLLLTSVPIPPSQAVSFPRCFSKLLSAVLVVVRPQSSQSPFLKSKRELTTIQKIQTTTSSSAVWKFPPSVSSQISPSSMLHSILSTTRKATIILRSLPWVAVLAFSLLSSQNLTVSQPAAAIYLSLLST